MPPSTEETRYPYLDKKLVEFLSSIPTEQLLRPGHRRSLMRRALADLLPHEILTRRTKGTASHYIPAALKKYWNELETILQSPVLSHFGYINQEQFLAALIAAKHGYLTPNYLRLSRALSWELWTREVVGRRLVSVQPELSLASGSSMAQSRAY